MTATRIGFNQSQVVSGHACFMKLTVTASEGSCVTDPAGTISVTTSLDDLVRFLTERLEIRDRD
jgi:hypothetical protein